MKKILLLLLLLVVLLPGFGQSRSQIVETVTSAGITWSKIRKSYSYTIESPGNVKMDQHYVYLNGSQAPDSLNFRSDLFGFSISGIDQAFNNTFTAAERARCKDDFVGISLVFDNTGKTIEVSFSIDVDSGLAQMPLQKFVTWIQYIKRYVRAELKDPQAKQLQFMQGTAFYSVK